MVTIVKTASVQGESCGTGAVRRRLLTRERVPGVKVLVDRLSMGAGGSLDIRVPAGAIGWVKILQGNLVCECSGEKKELGDVHVVLLPQDSMCRISSAAGAEILYAEVPNARELDPMLDDAPLQFRAVDWSREPVLDSKYDARKRIYVATPKLTGTKALKAEIIIYPKGTTGSNHHHEGAEHFIYVLEGSTTGYANEEPHRYVTGDLVYHPDGERHYSSTGKEEGMRFIEFFVPATFNTVWANEGKICTWEPTGKDSRGGKPVREIQAHDSKSAAVTVPPDL